MHRRKSLPALAAVTAVLALAVPAANASAATTTANVGTASSAIDPTACQLLVFTLQGAQFFQQAGLANVLSNVSIQSGCGGAAI
jgi:spermidine/putrescine-binding protein